MDENGQELAALIEETMNRLEITRQEIGEIVIWHCAGEIIRGAETAALLERVTSSPATKIVLDLQNVYDADAAGLGALVSLLAWSRAHRKEFILVNPAERVRSILQLTNLDSVLPICDGNRHNEICAAAHAA